MRFPKGTKAFWDDTHYIFYVDPNVRLTTVSNCFLYFWCAYDDGNEMPMTLHWHIVTGFVLITHQLKGEVAAVAKS